MLNCYLILICFQFLGQPAYGVQGYQPMQQMQQFQLMQQVPQNPNQSNANQSSQVAFNPNAQIPSSAQQKQMEAIPDTTETQRVDVPPGYHTLSEN